MSSFAQFESSVRFVRKDAHGHKFPDPAANDRTKRQQGPGDPVRAQSRRSRDGLAHRGERWEDLPWTVWLSREL